MAAGGGGTAATVPPAVAPVPMSRVVGAQSARPVAAVTAAVRPAGDGGTNGRAPRAVWGGGWWLPAPVVGMAADGCWWGRGGTGLGQGQRRRAPAWGAPSF